MAASAQWWKSPTTLQSLTTTSAEITRRALNLPQTYAEYVASNSQSVSRVESTLRSLTFLVPGARLHDSELTSESLNTFIQLLSIYHDHLLKKKAKDLATSSPLLRSPTASLPKSKLSQHARYTTFWSDSSSLYTQVATILKIAQYTELLWEMIARRTGGERSRWRVVILLESFKAACRLVLLRLTGSRPLVTPVLPSREDFAPVETGVGEEFADEDLKMMAETDFDAKLALGDAGVPTPPMSESDKVPAYNPAEPFSMPRTGLTLPMLPTPEAVSSYLFSHVITADDVRPVKQLMHRLGSFRGQAAEVLYILRPLIYALLMQRVARRYGYEGNKWKKNWTPWLIGLSIEYLARQLAKQELASHAPRGSVHGLGALEREEFAKRGWSLGWWTMRGAFYENVTKPKIHSVAEILKGQPILNLVGGVLEDYEYLWSNYYFSTATM